MSLKAVAELYIDYINAERLKFGYPTEQLDYTIQKGIIKLQIPTYYYAIEAGRKVFERKIPIVELIKWLKSIGRVATNSLAFAIQNSIYQKGIRPKNGFITDPLAEAAEPASLIIAIDLKELLETKIKKIK